MIDLLLSRLLRWLQHRDYLRRHHAAFTREGGYTIVIKD